MSQETWLGPAACHTHRNGEIQEPKEHSAKDGKSALRSMQPGNGPGIPHLHRSSVSLAAMNCWLAGEPPEGYVSGCDF